LCSESQEVEQAEVATGLHPILHFEMSFRGPDVVTGPSSDLSI